MEIPVKIQLLNTGKEPFEKTEWGYLNVFVGPNGSGKTTFARELKKACTEKGLKVRYLNAERLTDFAQRIEDPGGRHTYANGFDLNDLPQLSNTAKERDSSFDAYAILQQKLDLKIKIEATLSNFFGKQLTLHEESGFLKPKIISRITGKEYDIKEQESHGLKEIISLLTILYDDDNNCLIIDEPELHIHPQFQTFFLSELKKLTGNSEEEKKCFFIITHSPFFIELSSVDDLKNLLVFHINKNPTFVDSLTSQDEYRLNRLFPRWNVHHKQLFFSSLPLFVEGYTDQQILLLIQERRGMILGANGTSIINVDGKENLDVFLRLCNQLKINSKIICDLDVIFKSELKQTISKQQRCIDYLTKKNEKNDFNEIIGTLDKLLDETILRFQSDVTGGKDEEFDLLLKELERFENELNKKRFVFLIAIQRVGLKIIEEIPELKNDFEKINEVLEIIIGGFLSCDIHILKKGQIENYIPSYQGNPYQIQSEQKFKILKNEEEEILEKNFSIAEMEKRYSELIQVINQVMPLSSLNFDPSLNRILRDWIHTIQIAVHDYKITSKEEMESNKKIDYNNYKRILTILEFEKENDGFTCKIKLNTKIDKLEREFSIDHEIVPSKFELPT